MKKDQGEVLVVYNGRVGQVPGRLKILTPCDKEEQRRCLSRQRNYY